MVATERAWESYSATLSVKRVRGQSVAAEVHARTPFRWLVPRARGESVWAYGATYGGGLVSGDVVSIRVNCGAGTACYIGTQASTKVYRTAAGGGVRQTVSASLSEGAFLAWVPDVVQPFESSDYRQIQCFDLAPGAGLVLLDWFCSGRMARGERWRFTRYHTRTELRSDSSLWMLDSLQLDSTEGVAIEFLRQSGFECFATLVICGGMLAEEIREIQEAIKRQPALRRSALHVSAGAIRGGGVLVRCGGVGVEEVRNGLAGLLDFLKGHLGENPLLRKN